MISRFDRSSRAITIESQRIGGRTALLHAVAAATVAGVFAALVWGGLWWLLEGEFGGPLLGLLAIVAVVFIGFVFPFLLAPSALWGWERIDVRGPVVAHERWVRNRLSCRAEYDLLKMRGLEITGGEAPMLPAHIGLRFWYRNGARFIGDTLNGEERQRVADTLIEYDRAFRSSLGMDPERGLAWRDVWQSSEARQAELDYVYSQQRFDAHPFIDPADRADC